MKFNELNFNELANKEVDVNINNKDVKVKQYLPISDKISLVQIALQQSEEDGIYNEGLLTAYFYTYIVMFYSDLEFTDEQKQNIPSLYDILETNDVITKICDAIPKIEFDDLLDLLQDQKNNNTNYKTSAAYLIGQFINTLPEQMNQVAEIVNNFDPSKYQAVVDFATAANGGRNINTNQPIE